MVQIAESRASFMVVVSRPGSAARAARGGNKPATPTNAALPRKRRLVCMIDIETLRFL
jgi:hypothetical protein